MGYGTGVLKAHLKKSILCILGDPRDKNMTKPSSKIRRDCCPLTLVRRKRLHALSRHQFLLIDFTVVLTKDGE